MAFGPLGAAPADNAQFERSLTGRPGDARRGREIVFDRTRGNCTICHAVPVESSGAAQQRLLGDLGPSLAGVGARLAETTLRMRMIDSRLLNAETIMPAYHATNGLARVGAAYAGRPVLTADEIEDVVTYLSTLRQ